MKTAMAAVTLFLIAVLSSVPVKVTALGGSASTIAVVYGGNVTVCGITSESRSSGGIKCWQGNQVTDVYPNVSFDYLAGGRDLFCGLISGGFTLLCFDSTFRAKRLYRNQTIGLKDLTVGEGQICALTNGTRNARCWRGGGIPPTFTSESDRFLSISSGIGFSCGVLMNSNRVVCRGSNRELASSIEAEFRNDSMNNIIAGGNFACGLSLAGFIVCRGRNESGQLNVPQNNSGPRYSSLALGNSHGCAIRNSNGSVVCWGNQGGEIDDNISFESIVAGFNFTCGLITSNLSVICWGSGWPTAGGMVLPLGQVLPGPCVQSDCGQCGIYLQSQSLCFNSGNICKTCDLHIPPPTPTSTTPRGSDDSVPPQPSPASHSKGLRKGLLAFAIIGSIGTVSGICTLLYCLWTGACCGHKKIHNSVQPTIAVSNSNNGRTSNPFSRSSTLLRRQGSRMMMRRQRSGTSSFKHPERAEEFSFQDLSAATNNFTPENKIGAGSFGVVYRGKLLDGREVAIKRGDTDEQLKKFQEKESAFDSELAFLSRLHHKHLVGLVGYCEEGDEKLLVYDYMKNGALYDHLHHRDRDNIDKDSINKDDNNSVLNSWKMRISIALDASRGIEYLHNYAVPPIIHRDIKSSNILLDSNWTARVSDFGLSLLGPQSDRDFRPTKAAGTVGYIDPEYYGLNVLTTKSDVYGLGIVLLELLTGKRAIFKNAGEPTSVVDFAVPAILSGELRRILDARVGGPSEGNEAEAVELVAYAAVQCVNREGIHRPTMSDMVTNLERALGMLVGSNGSINSGPMSIVSD